jgi:hypothetical protein
MGNLGQVSTYYHPYPVACDKGEHDEKPIRYCRHGERNEGGGARDLILE